MQKPRYHIYGWDARPSLHMARTRPSVEFSHECGVTHVTHVCTYHTHITGVRAWWYGRYHHCHTPYHTTVPTISLVEQIDRRDK